MVCGQRKYYISTPSPPGETITESTRPSLSLLVPLSSAYQVRQSKQV